MPRERQTTSPLFILVAIIAVVTALYVAKQILLPFALAVLLSFLLTPLANRIDRWGLPRVPSVIMVVVISFAVLGLLGWIVTDQLIALSRELPAHQTKILAKVRTLKNFTRDVQEKVEKLTNDEKAESLPKRPETSRLVAPERQPSDSADIDEPIDERPAAPLTATDLAFDSTAQPRAPAPSTDGDEVLPVKVVSMPPSPLTQIQSWLGPLVAPLTAAGMVIVMVFFMLLDRENQRNRIIQLFGMSNLHTTTEAIHDATHRVGRYLRMQFLINAGYGIAVTLGLWLIGVPSAIMWGVLGFSLRFLPYLGPWIAAVMPIMVSLAVSDGWTQSLLVVGMYIVYELLLNNVAEPMLYGSSVGVSTVGVIIAAVFWTWLWGPIGLIMAMPMTVCFVVTAQYVPQLRFITVLFADQPPLSLAERVYQRLLAFDDNEPLKLAHKYLKESSLASFYDDVLIPALTLAEIDRHAGLLNEDQEAFFPEAAEDLVEALADSAVAPVDDNAGETPADGAPHESVETAARILCIPLRDQADETAIHMLAQLLAAEGFQVEKGGADSLTGELVDRVATANIDIVVISILPPIRPRENRLLWKRLRNRYPDLPIIVGYWIGANRTESLLPPQQDDASKVATTLAEAVSLVRTTAAQIRFVPEEPKRVDAAG